MKNNNKFLLTAFVLLSTIHSYAQISTVFGLVGATLGQPGLLGYYYDSGGNIDFVPGTATCSSAVQLTDGLFNLDDLESNGFLLPLVLPAGATIEGTYDLLTNPAGTLLFSDVHRSQFSLDHDVVGNMFLLSLEPGDVAENPNCRTTLKNIHLRGPNHAATDFNIGLNALCDPPGCTRQINYCGGILIATPWGISLSSYTNSDFGYGYDIANCEIEGFSFSGIMVDERADDISITNCYIHHIKHNAIKGSGYEVLADFYVDPIKYSKNVFDITIANCIFDDGKSCLDGTAFSPFNTRFVQNSITQFCGGINIHNNANNNFPHAAVSSCNFYHELYNSPDRCEDASPLVRKKVRKSCHCTKTSCTMA